MNTRSTPVSLCRALIKGGILLAVLLGGITPPPSTRAEEPDPQVKKNLLELYEAFQVWRKDHGGEFPPLSLKGDGGRVLLWPELLKKALHDPSPPGHVRIDGPFFSPSVPMSFRRGGKASLVSYGYNTYALGADAKGGEIGPRRRLVREVPNAGATLLLVESEAIKQPGLGWYQAYPNGGMQFGFDGKKAHVLFCDGSVRLMSQEELDVGQGADTHEPPWFGDLSKQKSATATTTGRPPAASLPKLPLGVPQALLNDRIEVLGPAGESPASLHDWTLCPNPRGAGQLLVMAFRRDRFILVVDLATREVTKHELSGMPYGITTGKDGRVYLGTSQAPGAFLFCFDPKENRVEQLGGIENETMVYWLKTAPDGTIYGGTNPGNLLFSLDPKTRKITNLGALSPDQTHACFGAVGRDGLVYAAVGMRSQALFEYNPVSGAKRDVWPKDWVTNHVPRVYMGEDGLVYAYPGIATPASEGRCLKISPGGKVEQVANGVRQAMGCMPPSFPAQPRLENGWQIVEASATKVLLRKWSEGGEHVSIPLPYGGGVKSIYSIALGPDGRIYASTKPSVLMAFDPATRQIHDLREITSFKAGQVDSMCAANGRLYLGTYTHATVHTFNPSEPSQGVRTIGRIGQEQDRPWAMVSDRSGNVYVGTAPGYGLHNGALACLRKGEETFTVWRSVIPRQSIAALAVDDGRRRLYLGSSVHGGSGSATVAETATLAEWDLDKHQVLRTVQVPGAISIAALLVVPDGPICGLTREGEWFGVDPNTFSVSFRRSLRTSTSVPWRATLAWDARSRSIYGSLGQAIFRAPANHPENCTMVAQLIDGQEIGAGVVCDRDGNVYFSVGINLMRWRPPPT